MKKRTGCISIVVLLCMLALPASGSLTDQENGGTLYFSCESMTIVNSRLFQLEKKSSLAQSKPIH